MSGVGTNIRALTLTLAAMFLVASVGVSYWTVFASDALANDPFNPRLIALTKDRPRGAIVDRNGAVIASSDKTADGFARSYKDRSLAQVTGYASVQFGLAGIEKAYAESLIGQDAADPVSVWKARYLGERAPAGAVVLTIDEKIQKAAADALGSRRGAIVALDPRTGAILASVSVPTYDPNQVADPARAQGAMDQLNKAQDHPLLNRATQGQYPPGSTFKVVTAAAALESGFDATKKLRVDDPYQPDKSWGDYFVRSASHAHGLFDMSDGFRLSENIYFAQVGLQIGGAKLAEYAKRFGVGAAPKVELPASGGQLSESGSLDKPTLVADTAYGQGELLVSPLQMALIYAAIANNGVMPTPHYGAEVRDADGRVVRQIAPGPGGQVISPNTAHALTTMLVGAVEGPGAFAFGGKVPGVHVAGKTGTAENRPGEAPHGWFIGFAPAEAPTVVVAVIVENAPDGGVTAAPLGAQVMRAALGK
ncbi:MAG: cell division protein FtsI [Chloroflexi bacterium]|nr:MAG: cell division protein FtsI [Chloroflexota bacterium]TMF25085.1 MAG: cell division protein FtsI [Chloroflexota bacterium]